MIKVRGLVKAFNGKKVLNGIDFDVAQGESCVVIGRSGCGKSVLLKHLIGLFLPDQGQIWIDGRQTIALSKRERYELRLKFGMLFQGAALFDSLTVAENVAFALREHSSLSAKQIDERVKEALEWVGLRGIERMNPEELSGGMKKRVGLARAIVMKPEILLFDEPTSGLDPVTADAINRLMIQLNSRLKITSVAVTHDMASAYRLASRICMLHEGRICFSGNPEEIKKTTDPVVRGFITGRSEESIRIEGER